VHDPVAVALERRAQRAVLFGPGARLAAAQAAIRESS